MGIQGQVAGESHAARCLVDTGDERLPTEILPRDVHAAGCTGRLVVGGREVALGLHRHPVGNVLGAGKHLTRGKSGDRAARAQADIARDD